MVDEQNLKRSLLCESSEPSERRIKSFSNKFSQYSLKSIFFFPMAHALFYKTFRNITFLLIYFKLFHNVEARFFGWLLMPTPHLLLFIYLFNFYGDALQCFFSSPLLMNLIDDACLRVQMILPGKKIEQWTRIEYRFHSSTNVSQQF